MSLVIEDKLAKAFSHQDKDRLHYGIAVGIFKTHNSRNNEALLVKLRPVY